MDFDEFLAHYWQPTTTMLLLSPTQLIRYSDCEMREIETDPERLDDLLSDLSSNLPSSLAIRLFQQKFALSWWDYLDGDLIVTATGNKNGLTHLVFGLLTDDVITVSCQLETV